MPRIQKRRLHLVEKRDEIIWALSFQDYNNEEIGEMFNRHRSSIGRIIDKMPKDWKPKWVKKLVDFR